MWKNFYAALSFLTVIPGKGLSGKDELSASTPYFPIVGLLIGASLALLAYASKFFFPSLAVSAILVVAAVAVSGGLHLDGLSDSADGLLSSRSKERILEIMKDSHVGAMGVLAIAAVFLLKFSALASIPLKVLPLAIFLVPLAGRCAILVMTALLPYARPEGGLGAFFAVSRPRVILHWSIFLLFSTSALVLGAAGVISASLTLLVVVLFAGFCRSKIGGTTGDTLGAACEIAEMGIALFLCAFLR